jgi:hypothetical protein
LQNSRVEKFLQKSQQKFKADVLSFFSAAPFWATAPFWVTAPFWATAPFQKQKRKRRGA